MRGIKRQQIGENGSLGKEKKTNANLFQKGGRRGGPPPKRQHIVDERRDKI